MYTIYKKNLSMGLIDHMPTEEELISLGCDSYREYIEPLDERKARIKLALISTPDLSQVEINPEDFSDKEIGDIIVARCFGGNPHAESALQAKTNAYLLSVME